MALDLAQKILRRLSIGWAITLRLILMLGGRSGPLGRMGKSEN
jgi:hypothetical protein